MPYSEEKQSFFERTLRGKARIKSRYKNVSSFVSLESEETALLYIVYECSGEEKQSFFERTLWSKARIESRYKDVSSFVIKKQRNL